MRSPTRIYRVEERSPKGLFKGWYGIGWSCLDLNDAKFCLSIVRGPNAEYRVVSYKREKVIDL